MRRRPRRHLCRRWTGRLRRDQRLPPDLGAEDPLLAGLQEERASAHHLRRGRGGGHRLEDATACCDELPSISAAGTQTGQAGLTGPGGGRVGLLALSPFISPGTTTATPYNHFSLLRTIEDIFGLPHLGEAAAPGLASFGADVFTKPRG